MHERYAVRAHALLRSVRDQLLSDMRRLRYRVRASRLSHGIDPDLPLRQARVRQRRRSGNRRRLLDLPLHRILRAHRNRTAVLAIVEFMSRVRNGALDKEESNE